MKKLLLPLLLCSAACCLADEFSIRNNNALASSQASLFDQNTGSGKLLQLRYQCNLPHNLYAVGAVGAFYQKDYDKTSAYTTEVGIGFQVTTGNVRAYVEQTEAYFNPPSHFSKFETGMHYGLSLLDETTKATLGVERTHYSNGNSDPSANPSFDATGLVLGWRF